jgi:GNAT superfamily N-acetyltransferase
MPQSTAWRISALPERAPVGEAGAVTDVRRTDPHDDAALRAWFAVEQAAQRHDRPQAALRTYAALADARRHPNPYGEAHLLAAHVDGRPVGVAEVTMTLQDNLHLAELAVNVLPEHRRRGIGRALHDAADALRRDAGRSTVLAELAVAQRPGARPPGHEPEVPGLAFARALGFTTVHVEDHLVLPLPVEPATAAALRRPTPGYEILTWGQRCPDEHRAAYCRMRTQMEHDVPLGDIAYEPTVVDEARLNSQEERLDRSYHQLVAAARHVASGELVAYSIVLLARDGDQALQEDTLVMPEHRGHGLGLQLKLATLGVLQREHSASRALHTWTDRENVAMHAVNLRFGYRVAEVEHELQRVDPG